MGAQESVVTEGYMQGRFLLMRCFVVCAVLAGTIEPVRSQSVLDNLQQFQQIELQRQQIEMQRLQLQQQKMRLQEVDMQRQLEFERQQAESYRLQQIERAKGRK